MWLIVFTVPWVDLRCMIVAFPGHTYLFIISLNVYCAIDCLFVFLSFFNLTLQMGELWRGSDIKLKAFILVYEVQAIRRRVRLQTQ